jgi:hypothetical protein
MRALLAALALAAYPNGLALDSREIITGRTQIRAVGALPLYHIPPGFAER